MERDVYENQLTILNAELIPAMGCTEPIAVAYAAAKARAVLGCMPERIVMYCSGNIIKNVMGVSVPNSGGQKGINAAAILGAVGGREDKELEVLNSITPEQIEESKRLAAKKICVTRLVEGEENLYVRAEVSCGGETALVEIKKSHNHISRIEKNGKVLLYQEDVPSELHGDKSRLDLKDIYDFACCVEIEDVRETIMRQAMYNIAISEEGLKDPWGAQVGRTMMETACEGDIYRRLAAGAAAGSDARMSGCPMPVVINSGSGNQGMTISVPIVMYAREKGCTQEQMIRALVLANLISLHQKYYIGNLSAYCGATSAGASAACGVAFLNGEPFDVIAHTVVNAINTIGGMVCDGAKCSCAGKIFSSLNTAFMGYELARRQRDFKPGEGIIAEDAEQTIRNVGRMGKIGMKQTDVEILNIMLGN